MDDQEWLKIRQQLSELLKISDSERFVDRVMAELRPAARPAIRWEIRLPDLARWLVPALGAGLAMAMMVAAWPSITPAVPTERLLLIDGKDDQLRDLLGYGEGGS